MCVLCDDSVTSLIIYLPGLQLQGWGSSQTEWGKFSTIRKKKKQE